jgi:hypothetical protein
VFVLIANQSSLSNEGGYENDPPDPPAPPPVPGTLVVVIPPVQFPLEVNMVEPLSFLVATNPIPPGF